MTTLNQAQDGLDQSSDAGPYHSPYRSLSPADQARAAQAEAVVDAIAGAVTGVRRAVGALRRRVRRAIERRRALDQLAQLDDRMLADIGVSRGSLQSCLLEAEQRATVEASGGHDKHIVTGPATVPPAANQDGRDIRQVA